MAAQSTTRDLASFIDHTLLKPAASAAEIEQLCREALDYRFASVCVNGFWAPRCRPLLQGSGVKLCCVVGFPLGAMAPAAKAFEAADAVAAGADEIDMVINLGALKSGEPETVERDIRGVVEAARGRAVKVILETGLLSEAEKVLACQLSQRAGAAFVKTATGFVTGSAATAEDVALMRRTVGAALGVKASGGIRSREDAELMIASGASRLGTSSGIAIVTRA
ncbi:MAG: deoxyribose-phosphate aldolase [Holophaga sp.]|nr:deoxyribose-phosphate aldolase [Holophaga sp.]